MALSQVPAGTAATGFTHTDDTKLRMWPFSAGQVTNVSEHEARLVKLNISFSGLSLLPS